MIDSLAPPQAAQDAVFFCPPSIRGNDDRDMFAHRFFGSVSKEPLAALWFQFCIDSIQIFVKIASSEEDTGSEITGGLFRLLSCCNIHEHVDAANNFSLIITEQRRIWGEPPLRTIRPFRDGLLLRRSPVPLSMRLPLEDHHAA